MNTSNDYTIASVQKALKILKLYDCKNKNTGCEFTLMDIVNKLGYSKSTVLRLLYTLNKENFIKFDDETKKYSLSVTMLRLGTAAHNNLDIRRIVAPHIKELVEKVNLVVFFALVNEDQIIIIDKVFPNNVTTIPYMSAQIGLPLPLYSTGIGRLYLGEKTDEEKRELLKKINIVPMTKNTITDIDEIIKKANKCKDKGIAYGSGENEDYISSICCPIRNNKGEMVAGISLGGITDVLEGENKSMYEQSIVSTAADISRELGYRR